MPLVLITVVVVFAANYYPVAKVQYRETRHKEELQAQLKALQDRNARLRSEVASLETTEGVEDYARGELGMVQRGENAIIVTDSSDSTHTSGEPEPGEHTGSPPIQPAGPWTAFLDFVFGMQ